MLYILTKIFSPFILVLESLVAFLIFFIADVTNDICLPLGRGDYYSLYNGDEVSGNYYSYILLIYNHNVNEYVLEFISWCSFFNVVFICNILLDSSGAGVTHMLCFFITS